MLLLATAIEIIEIKQKKIDLMVLNEKNSFQFLFQSV